MGSLNDTLIPLPKRIDEREGTINRFQRLCVQSQRCAFDIRENVKKYGAAVVEGTGNGTDCLLYADCTEKHR